MLQSLIDEYTARTNALVSAFEDNVRSSIDSIISQLVGGYLLADYSSGEEDKIRNRALIGGLDREFNRAYASSGFPAALSAFVSLFSTQVDEFSTFYEEARAANPQLPDIYLTAEDRDILATQAAISVSVLGSIQMETASSLLRLSSISLTDGDIASLTQGVTEIIQRMIKVVPKGHDLLNIFFRTIGNLIYSHAEARGITLHYAYVGPIDNKNREFCEDLLSGTNLYTRAQIDAMDNGKTGNAFVTGGGPGCRHWFMLA